MFTLSQNNLFAKGAAALVQLDHGGGGAVVAADLAQHVVLRVHDDDGYGGGDDGDVDRISGDNDENGDDAQQITS